MRSVEEIRLHDMECLRIREDEVEYIVTTSCGPRVLQFGHTGREGVLGVHPHAQVETSHGIWRPIGGHRLWVAPESHALSYAPDNDEVEIEEDDDAIELCQCTDAAGIQKQITLSVVNDSLILDHAITNVADSDRTVACWPLTIMRPMGRAILPQEPQKLHGESLLPARTLSLWSYTDLSDPRWTFERSAITIRVDESMNHPQKIGAANRQGWLAYQLPEVAFVKSFTYEDDAQYPDMGSNCEIYTAGSFVELESLGPLRTLSRGMKSTHREVWTVVYDGTIELSQLQAIHESHRPLLALPFTSSQPLI